MSTTNAQKRKLKKRKDSRKAFEKKRNIQNNLGPLRYRWDVFFDGRWTIGFKEYRKWKQVQEKLDETEALRKEGEEIIAGRVFDLEFAKVVKEIDPSPAKAQGKGALPDKLADTTDAAKGVIGMK
jgi:hypothetical protein